MAKAIDTTYLDSVSFANTGMFSLQVQTAFGSSYLLPGDSAIATLSATYSTTNIPYYPKKFSILVHAHSVDSLSSHSEAPAFVYFTPYNTTEVWSKADFYMLPRVWETPKSPVPQRVSIPKTSIPSTNIEPVDSTTQA